jgi:hypothetical protein
MMGPHTHRWLSSDKSSSLSAYENNGSAPTDQNVIGQTIGSSSPQMAYQGHSLRVPDTRHRSSQRNYWSRKSYTWLPRRLHCAIVDLFDVQKAVSAAT